MLDINKRDLSRHRTPRTFADRFAEGTVRAMTSIAGLFGRRDGGWVSLV